MQPGCLARPIVAGVNHDARLQYQPEELQEGRVTFFHSTPTEVAQERCNKEVVDAVECWFVMPNIPRVFSVFLDLGKVLEYDKDVRDPKCFFFQKTL